jgi:hypothetical protein
MNTLYQETLAGLLPAEVDFILDATPRPEGVSAATARMAAPGGRTEEGEPRRRRHIEREWPEIGTRLYADYCGTRYQAETVTAAKKLKSGKQIRIASGPAIGEICDSFTEAMTRATEKQREKQNLGRKGVSNGWEFWQWDGKPADITGGNGGDEGEDGSAEEEETE